MKRICLVSVIVFVLVSASQVTAQVPSGFNVKDYGAAGDGKTLDTAAINKTIDACSKAGGGTVYFPAGTYLSGSIRLKSNITLHIGPGATILGAANDINAYDATQHNPSYAAKYQDFGHSHWRNSLIWGEELENIAITGQGTINGGGMTRDRPPPGGGNKTIALKLCRNILIKDITIRHAGHFAILPTGCDNMVIDGVKVDTNRDGINIDCCRNVRVANCTINSPFDDGLCLKSTYALGYKRATQNVTVTNCMLSGYVEGTMLDGTFDDTFTRHEGTGGIKFGTESNGGFKNITINNCVFDNCAGFSLEIVDGGTMESVNISNIVMRGVTSAPVFMRLGNRARGPENPPVGKIRNINISNLLVDGSYKRCGSSITGIPGHPIEAVKLSNIKIIYDGGGTKEDAKIEPPEKEKGYPRSDMFGTLPSYGFYCRHVKGLEFHNVEVSFKIDDLRPALICDDVVGLVLDNFKAQSAADGEPSIVLKNVKDVLRHDYTR